MNESRIVNSARNIIVSFISQFVLLVLGFVSRSVFIRILSTDYLGVNGLFGNIISVLSLADLGIGGAITFALFRPIANGDKRKIGILINYYKKVYRMIAGVVLVLGLLIVPFLNYIVVLEYELPDLTFIYLLFLINSVISYLWAYKACLIDASQNSYVTKIYSTVAQIARTLLQILVLLLTHNYFLFLIVEIGTGIVNNKLIARKSEKMFPYIRGVTEHLSVDERRLIFSDIKSIMIYRLGGVAVNNTDNLLISTLVNTAAVGLLSNYMLIVGSVRGFTDSAFSALSASVGNMHARENQERQEELFRALQFAAFWICGFCSVCIYCLLNDFINIWIGAMYCMDQYVVASICLQFYLPGILSVVSMFRGATGLFRKTKYVYLLTAIVNLILSVLLGRIYGVAGILFATTIARLLTNVWYEPMLLYSQYFNKSVWVYIHRNLAYIATLIALCGAVELVALIIPKTIIGFLIKLGVCIVLVNGMIFLMYSRKAEYKFIVSRCKALLKRACSNRSDHFTFTI